MLLILNELKFSDARSLVKTAQMSARNDKVSSYDKWIKYLEDNGYQELGSGAFSTVYGKGNSGVVVRISNDPAWLKFYEFAYKNQRKNKHLPRIGKIVDAADGHYLVFMERLYPAHIPMHAKTVLRWIMRQTNGGRREFVAPMKELNKDLAELLGSSFARLVDVLRSKKQRGEYEWDLSFLNVMERKDGTLVITDPYA